MDIEKLFKEARDAAAAIIERGEKAGRALTNSELKECSDHIDRAEGFKKQLAEIARAKSMVGALATGIPAANPDGSNSAPVGGDTKSAFAGRFAAGAAAALKARADAVGGGRKALIGTSVAVPPVMTEGVTLPRARNTILDLIGVKEYTGTEDDTESDAGNVVGYLYQSVRTSAAQAIEDGAVKPTSTYTWEERTDRFRTFAHISEPLPIRFLADYAQTMELLKSEMGYGLLNAVEAAVIVGKDSTASPDDSFDGIQYRAGVQTQAAVGTSILDTLAAGAFALTSINERPTGLVLNPIDAQKIKLLREGGVATNQLLFGSGRSSLADFIGEGVTVVTSTAVPAGKFLVGDFDQCKLLVRQNATLDIDASGTLFTKNQFIMRLENRVTLAVYRPAAFVWGTLPA